MHIHQWGRRDFQEGRELLVPIFLKEEEEQYAYVAGYKGEKKRSQC